jgi:predicted metal-dependent HD superfamily phosphohydrolase
VLSCIDATHYPQVPHSIESQVLCDADFFHLTRPDYKKYEEGLREEFKIFLNKEYTDAEWKEINCAMLCSHQYFTEYGKNVLQKLKEINLKSLTCSL